MPGFPGSAFDFVNLGGRLTSPGDFVAAVAGAAPGERPAQPPKPPRRASRDLLATGALAREVYARRAAERAERQPGRLAEPVAAR